MKLQPSLLRAACVATLLVGSLSSQALILTTASQTFVFGPGDLDYSESAALATFNEPGTLLGVHIELSGSSLFTLTANSKSNPGRILGMTEDTSFMVTGLPYVSLGTVTPTYTVGAFNLGANSTRTFTDTGVAPTVSADLSALFQLAAYDMSVGAPSSLPFQFDAFESFSYTKSGSGLSAGSDASATGTVSVWYTYELTSPPPVPEVSTAVSAAGFALIGGIFVLRNRKKTAPVKVD